MNGLLYINGLDAWEQWKIGLIKGSYASLMSLVPPKEYIKNSNQNQNGTQVFFDPKVSERDVILQFGILCDTPRDLYRRFNDFKKEIFNNTVELSVPVEPVLTRYHFLFLSMTDPVIHFKNNTGTFSIRFNEPDPTNQESTLRTAYVLSSKGQVLTSNNQLLTSKIK